MLEHQPRRVSPILPGDAPARPAVTIDELLQPATVRQVERGQPRMVAVAENFTGSRQLRMHFTILLLHPEQLIAQRRVEHGSRFFVSIMSNEKSQRHRANDREKQKGAFRRPLRPISLAIPVISSSCRSEKRPPTHRRKE